MSRLLLETLFMSYRLKVLNMLLLNSSKRFHVREIARQTGTVPGTVNRELARLAEAGILIKVRQGNQLLYSANTDCPIYRELVAILHKGQVGGDETAIDTEVVAAQQKMIEIISDIQQRIDNKIQLSHSSSLQTFLMKKLKLLLELGEIMESDVQQLLYDAREVANDHHKQNISTVWKVVKKDLLMLEKKLKQ